MSTLSGALDIREFVGIRRDLQWTINLCISPIKILIWKSFVTANVLVRHGVYYFRCRYWRTPDSTSPSNKQNVLFLKLPWTHMPHVIFRITRNRRIMDLKFGGEDTTAIPLKILFSFFHSIVCELKARLNLYKSKWKFSKRINTVGRFCRKHSVFWKS